MTESTSDAALVARMARGDRTALAELYRQHAPRLLTLLQAMIHDRLEAEDLLHDVFIDSWRASASYDPSRGAVQSWLTIRARSRALDRIKSAGRRRVVYGKDEAAADAAAPDDAARGAHASELMNALDSIPQPQREVLILGYFQGLSSAEIAEVLELPLGTVKSRTRAALQALRDLFRSQDGAA